MCDSMVWERAMATSSDRLSRFGCKSTAVARCYSIRLAFSSGSFPRVSFMIQKYPDTPAASTHECFVPHHPRQEQPNRGLTGATLCCSVHCCCSKAVCLSFKRLKRTGVLVTVAGVLWPSWLC